MHNTTDITNHARFTVSQVEKKKYQIDIKELSLSTHTILISDENLQELVEKSMDKLSVSQKIDVIKYLAESIGGISDCDDPEFTIDDIYFKNESGKVYCTWKFTNK